jgi:hypothetical protein
LDLRPLGYENRRKEQHDTGVRRLKMTPPRVNSDPLDEWPCRTTDNSFCVGRAEDVRESPGSVPEWQATMGRAGGSV